MGFERGKQLGKIGMLLIAIFLLYWDIRWCFFGKTSGAGLHPYMLSILAFLLLPLLKML